MKSLNYISNIDFRLNGEIKTAFRIISIEIDLTEKGITNYKKVIALVIEFFKVASEEWLADGQSIDLFNECKTIAKLSYNIYNVPEQEE